MAKLKIVNRCFSLTLKCGKDVTLKMDVVDDSRPWHKRLDLLNFGSLKLLHQKNMIQGLPLIQEMEDACDGYALGNIINNHF